MEEYDYFVLSRDTSVTHCFVMLDLLPMFSFAHLITKDLRTRFRMFGIATLQQVLGFSEENRTFLHPKS